MTQPPTSHYDEKSGIAWRHHAGTDPRLPTLVCLPGGGSTGRYYDLHVPTDPSYSFADYARARGFSLLTVDALGTGASSRPPGPTGIHEQAAALNAALAGMPFGEPGIAPVGIAHSMGGYVAMHQQATAAPYARLAITGTTNQFVAPLGLGDTIERAQTPEARVALADEYEASIPDAFIEPGDQPLPFNYLDDADPAALQAHKAIRTVVPRRAAAESMVPGVTADDAALIDVPVLLAYGQVDVSPDPEAEPDAFPSSPSVELVLLEGSAHCHNVSRSRRQLWDRILDWVHPSTQ